jgi:hypothetical protein
VAIYRIEKILSEAANKESWFVQIEEQIATLMFGKKATFKAVAE